MGVVVKGEAVEVECPYCARPLFAIAEPQQVIHSRPACPDFRLKTAEEVVEAISAERTRN